MNTRGIWTGRSAIGRLAAILVVASAIGACGGAAATAESSSAASAIPSPSNLTSSPSAVLAGSPAAVPTPGPGQEFAIAMGLAQPASPAMSADAVAGSMNDFGFDLLRRLSPTGNTCASPASIALALGMLRPGARGLTATQMDEVLHSFGAPGHEAEIQKLLTTLRAQTFYDDSGFYSDDPAATPDSAGPNQILTIGDQVFTQPGMKLEPAYLNSLSSGYDAGVGLLDFQKDPEAARQVINKWVSKNTNGRIAEILNQGDLTKDTRIALANAIYFKGAWAKPFEAADTKPLPFTTGAGATVTVPTMAQATKHYYSAGVGYRAVELGFGHRGSLSMLIVVPDDMTTFVGGLTATKFVSIVKGESPYIVALQLPRFSVDTRIDLSETLKAMGMTDAFAGAADFSGITKDQHLVVSSVIHQANIDVDEQGTTAAAATVVGVVATSAGSDPVTTLNVDKPFLYFIHDKDSGAILFMGRINDPSLKS